MIVVSDTSPISNLIQIDRLYVLEELYPLLIIPPAVHRELLALAAFGYNLSDYEQSEHFTVQHPQNQSAVKHLLNDLDPGESEAIVLAQELNAQLLIIDERLGTQRAKTEGLETIGLVGCLINAKTSGIIPAVLPILDELETIAGFYLGNRFRRHVRDLVDE